MTNCIEVTTGRTVPGYGISRIQTGAKIFTVYAHRFVYEQAYGTIPNGMYVCHNCDNPSCINLDHLFLGSPQDNAVDMVNKGRHGKWNAQKTHCKYGHEFSKENTYITPIGNRQCKECRRIYQKRRRNNASETAQALHVQHGL